MRERSVDNFRDLANSFHQNESGVVGTVYFEIKFIWSSSGANKRFPHLCLHLLSYSPSQEGLYDIDIIFTK